YIFVYRTITSYGCTFQSYFTNNAFVNCFLGLRHQTVISYNPLMTTISVKTDQPPPLQRRFGDLSLSLRFRLFPFRSPLLREYPMYNKYTWLDFFSSGY